MKYGELYSATSPGQSQKLFKLSVLELMQDCIENALHASVPQSSLGRFQLVQKAAARR